MLFILFYILLFDNLSFNIYMYIFKKTKSLLRRMKYTMSTLFYMCLNQQYANDLYSTSEMNAV